MVDVNHKIHRTYLGGGEEKKSDRILHTGYYRYVTDIIFFIYLYGDS
jgi:hypothetical protein